MEGVLVKFEKRRHHAELEQLHRGLKPTLRSTMSNAECYRQLILDRNGSVRGHVACRAQRTKANKIIKGLRHAI